MSQAQAPQRCGPQRRCCRRCCTSAAAQPPQTCKDASVTLGKERRKDIRAATAAGPAGTGGRRRAAKASSLLIRQQCRAGPPSRPSSATTLSGPLGGWRTALAFSRVQAVCVSVNGSSDIAGGTGGRCLHAFHVRAGGDGEASLLLRHLEGTETCVAPRAVSSLGGSVDGCLVKQEVCERASQLCLAYQEGQRIVVKR